MPSPICQPAEIIATPSFQRDIENFRKQFRSVAQAIVDLLTNEIGPDPICGWAIPGWSSKVFKIRAPNRDIGVGKSRGFRLIYEWHADERKLWLLRLYTHSQMEDIAAKEIQRARQASGLT
jgi:mRNA-degrading endonuclease RelE of RelBE toxin-antitoxin system